MPNSPYKYLEMLHNTRVMPGRIDRQLMFIMFSTLSPFSVNKSKDTSCYKIHVYNDMFETTKKCFSIQMLAWSSLFVFMHNDSTDNPKHEIGIIKVTQRFCVSLNK